MLATYGLDVLDPAVSPRRVWVLSNRLPPWARSPGEPWSPEANLLALLVDHVAQLTWVTLQASGARGVSRPRPIPRPPRPGQRAAAGRLGPPRAPSGPAPSWGAAVRQLAAIPGVVVADG